jgi:head-tail adaptor
VAIISPQTAIAARPHLVRLNNPGQAVPDGDGGYTQGDVPLNPPELYVAIRPASAADIERVAGGVATAVASHIITGPFHPGITVETRIDFDDLRRGKVRKFSVTGVASPDERAVETVCACVELVP